MMLQNFRKVISAQIYYRYHTEKKNECKQIKSLILDVICMRKLWR